MVIFELRSRDRSLIISSQMETGEWHKKTRRLCHCGLSRAISFCRFRAIKNVGLGQRNRSSYLTDLTHV